jgi:hypothetical protein
MNGDWREIASDESWQNGLKFPFGKHRRYNTSVLPSQYFPNVKYEYWWLVDKWAQLRQANKSAP